MQQVCCICTPDSLLYEYACYESVQHVAWACICVLDGEEARVLDKNIEDCKGRGHLASDFVNHTTLATALFLSKRVGSFCVSVY
jgi:hypothetical protein